MRTFKRVRVPQQIKLGDRYYVFLSALERVGVAANEAGYPVAKVIIDNKNRKFSREEVKAGRKATMLFDDATEYYYICASITREQIKVLE